jgi:tRNA nucleotidyltransferase (CCA-adding enzyme)
MTDLNHLFASLEGVELTNLQVYAVGGAIRDTLLGLSPKDVDFVAVGTTPEILLNLGFRQVGKDFPVFLHPKSHAELALARTERKIKKGHTGFVVHADPSVTLETDLRRRDFTINAMALSREGCLIDPYGGQDDLNDRVLRHVSPAFSEDPLRVLRCIRFLAQLSAYGFKISTETVDLIKSMSHSLRELSVERIIVELDKTLSSTNPAAGLANLPFLGITETLIPDLQVVPDRFMCQSVDARLGEWILGNKPTLDCIEHYGKQFRLTNKRVQFITALIKLKDINVNDVTSCLELMNQLGWLRGNPPDQKLDELLIEFDQTQFIDFPVTRLFEMRDRVREITAAQFTKQGISGKALGEAIHAERLKVLSTEISAPGTAPGL